MAPPLETAWTAELTGDLRGEYQAFVRSAAGGHFAQMPAWDEVTRSVRSIHTRYFLARRAGKLIGCARVIRTSALGVPLPVALVERGPVVAAIADLSDVLAALVTTAGRHGIVRLQVMPYWAGADGVAAATVLAARGWKDVQGADGSHVRTLRVALDGDPFAGKERESLRRKLRQAEKAGATVRQAGEDAIAPLQALYDAMMRAQGRAGRPLGYFRALHDAFVAPGRAMGGAFFVAEHDGEPVAALFAAHHGDVATFVLGASTGAEKSFSKMGPPMAAAIRWAKDRGAQVFDLGGIPQEGDSDPKRASIAQFKFDFAKVPVVLTPEHARAIVPGLS